jgi:DnaJ-class molecular chaperone
MRRGEPAETAHACKACAGTGVSQATVRSAVGPPCRECGGKGIILVPNLSERRERS